MLNHSTRAFMLGAIVVTLLGVVPLSATAEQTVGLFQFDPLVTDGYVLFASKTFTSTYLVDNLGHLVHEWPGDFVVGNTAYLLDDGHLLKASNTGFAFFPGGGSNGLIRRFDWDGNVVWEFSYQDPTFRSHHDIEPLPNGNVLLIAWEEKSNAEAIAAGRNPALLTDGVLWPEHIIEVEPVGASGGNIVWEWHVWDHLIQDFDATKNNFGVVEDHPELVDINFVRNGGDDWLHSNAIDYRADFDQILLGVPWLNEVWVIDHSTTTAQAAGHTGGNSGKGGDILYRWGNPQAYRAGTAADQQLFQQHDAQWIDPGLPGAGNILVFNNGSSRPAPQYSTLDEIAPPLDGVGSYAAPAGPGQPYLPAAPTWTYTANPPESFYARSLSGVQRLANGGNLVCDGPRGRIFEMDATNVVRWEYVNPIITGGPMTQCDVVPPFNANFDDNLLFRATRIPAGDPRLAGKDLTPGGVLEIIPVGVDDVPQTAAASFGNHPNPFNPSTVFRFVLDAPAVVSISIVDLAGRHVDEALVSEHYGAGIHEVPYAPVDLASGVYVAVLDTGRERQVRKLVLVQ